MTERDLNLRKPSFLALGALLLLLIGAFAFYRHRLYFADASFIAFNVIYYQQWYIQADRYGSFITQMFLFLGQKFHLPLKFILISYAVSFNLFYLAVAAVLSLKLKQHALTILMALYYFLFVSAGYFWTNNELHQAVAWMFLWIGLTIYLGQKGFNRSLTLVLFSLLAFITLFTHFIVLIPTIFLALFLLAERKSWPFSKMMTLAFAGIVLLIMAVKFLKAGNNPYDNEHLQPLAKISLTDLWGFYKPAVVQNFFARCITNYWAATMVFFLSCYILIRKKKFLQLAITLACVLGFVILIGIVYAGYQEMPGDRNLFHIESEWQCMGILIAAGFVFYFLPSMKERYALQLLSAIFISRTVYILAALPLFSERTAMSEKILLRMQDLGITKLGIINDDRIRSAYNIYGTTGYES
ncbi:MAG: hypothetical protein EOO01_11615, partial [Chitinophagaceae bacterium]